MRLTDMIRKLQGEINAKIAERNSLTSELNELRARDGFDVVTERELIGKRSQVDVDMAGDPAAGGAEDAGGTVNDDQRLRADRLADGGGGHRCSCQSVISTPTAVAHCSPDKADRHSVQPVLVRDYLD